MTSYAEKRQAKRTSAAEDIYIEVLSSEANQEQNLVVKCSTRDISINGIRALSNLPVQAGAILELLVDFNADAMKYLLTGEVRWCKQIDETPSYECGFELVEAEHSDIFNWRDMFVTN